MDTGNTQELLANVFKLGDLVAYQDGSVVSRTIIKKPAGNVTVFAFDVNQELSEHTAPFDAMLQVLDGKAEIIIAGKSYNLNAGETIIMPANKPHAVKAPEKFKMLLTMVKQ